MLSKNECTIQNGQLHATQEKKRLLLIDDLESISTLYATILRLDGYMIKIVPSLEEAEMNLPSYQPHAIIVTLDPCHLKGLKLNALAPLNKAAPNIPLIAISVPRTAELIVSPYISAYLIMPFKIKQLRETVKSQIALSTAAASEFAMPVMAPALNRYLPSRSEPVYQL